MAQEFKLFDKKFAKYKGTLLQYEFVDKRFDAAQVAYGITWLESFTAKYKDIVWSTAEIRCAVYEADSADEWQKFRVALKGCSTHEKLYRLYFRDAVYNASRELAGFEQLQELIRIRNYIGALVRGGQLTTDWKVQR